jgi:hypothetical protein
MKSGGVAMRWFHQVLLVLLLVAVAAVLNLKCRHLLPSAPVLYPLSNLAIDGLPLRRGQTESDVKAVLSLPKEVWLDGSGMYWAYPGTPPAGRLIVKFWKGSSEVEAIHGYELRRGGHPAVRFRQPNSQMFAVLGRPERLEDSVDSGMFGLFRVYVYPVGDSQGTFGRLWIATWAGHIQYVKYRAHLQPAERLKDFETGGRVNLR